MATDSSEQLNLNNPTTTTTAAAEENPKKTLDDDSTTTAAVPPTTTEPDHLEEEEEEEEEPADEASDQPSVTTVDSDAKSGDDSKSAVAATSAAAAASPVAGDVVDVDPASNIQKKIRRAERFGISLQLTEEEKRNSRKERYKYSLFLFYWLFFLLHWCLVSVCLRRNYFDMNY